VRNNPFPLQNDRTWQNALEIVQSSVETPSAVPTLIRNSLSGLYGTTDFMHAAGFSGWNPRCLLRAANLPSEGDDITAADVAQAVDRLGVRTAAVVAGINFSCTQVLRSDPPAALWQRVFREMMTEIQVGHLFGAHASELGVDGGMVLGFVRCAGLAILLASRPREFAEWHAATQGVDSAHMAIEAFGCESYQVGSLLLQQLGFGPEVAIATAVAVGKLSCEVIESTPNIQRWKAGYAWVKTLSMGLSVPRDKAARDFFTSLTPQANADLAHPKQLEELYSSIGRIRRGGSSWVWHLPAGSYEITPRPKELIKQKTLEPYKTASGLYIDKSAVS
jgi:hypothetical protein